MYSLRLHVVYCTWNITYGGIWMKFKLKFQHSVFMSDPQMEDDSIYNMSQNRGQFFPPPLPMTSNAEPSDLYQVRKTLIV